MKKLVMGATAVLVLAACLYSAKFFAAGSGQGAVGQETDAGVEKPLSAKNEPESAPSTDISEATSQEIQTNTETEPKSETETETESVTDTQAAPDVNAKEKTTKEAQAKPVQSQSTQPQQPQPVQPQPVQPQPQPQPQPAQPQPQDSVTEVSRVYIEDCGQDTGYWEITYSDGHVEHIEE